jgi:hypothetical protein
MTGTALRVGICRSHRALLRCSAANQKNIASLCTNISHVAARRPAVIVIPLDRQQQHLWFSTEASKPTCTSDEKKKDDASDAKSNDEKPNDEQPAILYEGPFAQLSLRLKRVSVTTAALGVVGMPLLMALHGGDVPATGQLAVGGTAIMAAAGSTVALSFCFSPYVHKLERVDDTQIKATTANILGMRVETTFDPSKDVGKAAGSRPFCNFTAKGLPMYVHPEMVYDDDLRLQLIGEADLENLEKAKEAAEKNKDDDFL